MDQKRFATSAATLTSKEEKMEAKAMDALTRVEGEIDGQLLDRLSVDESREPEIDDQLLSRIDVDERREGEFDKQLQTMADAATRAEGEFE